MGIIIVKRTPEFIQWFDDVKDGIFKKKFNNRIERIQQGNFGSHKRLNEYLYELKFVSGKGHRVYYVISDNMIILWGGVKDGQSKDVKKANIILQQYME
ncbi:MAG: hypothetical protein Ctma_0677 [Catillopecten margaritatus gill symbiont]|uniref:Addiction module killer protein n=1 Tax=Catillopecten margaritatus gill symbiont TaxID=3083288 RepID=A0AAU6PG28_9GAMM